jgi:hypothetical protein
MNNKRGLCTALSLMLFIGLLILAGCGTNESTNNKSSKGQKASSAASGYQPGMLYDPNMTPAKAGYKGFDDPTQAMKEAGVSFPLPKTSLGGKFEKAYIGTNGNGEMGVALWYQNMVLTCYKINTPRDYQSQVQSVKNTYSQGAGAAAKPTGNSGVSTALKEPPYVTTVHGLSGMMWPPSVPPGSSAAGVALLNWTDGTQEFILYGNDSSFDAAKTLKIADSMY